METPALKTAIAARLEKRAQEFCGKDNVCGGARVPHTNTNCTNLLQASGQIRATRTASFQID
jgi:hypothetical protein